MRLSGLICGAILCLCAGLARAEDPLAGDWHLDLTSYLWAPSLNGDLTGRGRESPVNASFIDILKDSDSLIGIEGRLGLSESRVGASLVGSSYTIGAHI